MKPAKRARISFEKKQTANLLTNAAIDMDRKEMRKLVALSFTLDRLKQSTHRKYSHLVDDGLSHTVTAFCVSSIAKLNRQIESTLALTVDQHIPSRWARFMGLGPRTAVGLFAHIDVEKVEHISQLASYAGYGSIRGSRQLSINRALEILEEARALFMDPSDEACIKWIAGRVHRRYDTFSSCVLRCQGYTSTITWDTLRRALRSRPWNADLHQICWSIMFRMHIGKANKEHPTSTYYHEMFIKRKQYEMRRNEKKQYKDQAAIALSKGNYLKGSRVYNYYASGMLPPVHLAHRARRWALKLLLSHYLEVAYYDRYKGKKVPAAPYILGLLGEKDGKDRKIQVPSWPWVSR